MPTYEYICKNCEHEFEVFQSMTDSAKRKCPKCGKNALERKIGLGAAILFKGSGFYQTDYRSESYKKAAEAERPSDKKSDAKSEGRSESKSDSKPAKSESPAKSEPKSKQAKSKKDK